MNTKNFRPQREKRVRVNEMIKIAEVRVVDEEGGQLGVMATEDAKKLAEERSLDLVEIAPNVHPPVVKIMDYGKFKYKQSKKARQSKKKQHLIHLKEIKLRPTIEEHDLQFKLRNAEKFLEHKDKVKFTMRFRGREMEHIDLANHIFGRIKEQFSDIAVVEKEVTLVGRIMSMIIGPRSDKRGGR